MLVDQTRKRYSLSSDIPWLVGLSPDVSLKLFEFCGLAVIVHLPPYVGHNSFDHLLLACISIRDFHHPLHALLLVLFSLQRQVAINPTGIAKGVGVLGIAPSSNRVKLKKSRSPETKGKKTAGTDYDILGWDAGQVKYKFFFIPFKEKCGCHTWITKE